MRKLGPRLMPLLAALSTLTLGGCSILTTAPTDPPLSAAAAAVASAIGHVRPSKADTCETQVQVAAQSSRIATLQTGKETVYKADARCLAPSAAHQQPARAAEKPKVSSAPTIVVPFAVPVPPPALKPLPAWHERQVLAEASAAPDAHWASGGARK